MAYAFIFLMDFVFADINTVAAKSLADEVLSSKTNNKYQLLLAKLGGTRSNRRILIQTSCNFFLEADLQKTPRLSVFSPKKFWDG